MSLATLRLDYLPAAEIASRAPAWWQHVLGVVGFSEPPRIDRAQVPVTASMTPSLGAAGDLCEVWRVSGAPGLKLENGSPTGSLKHGEVRYRFCQELLFGSLTVEEQAFDREAMARAADDPSARAADDSLSRATVGAYRKIFDVLERTAHRHLIRVWNYLPEINREANGDERYRRFNSARQAAFRGSGRPTEVSVPAACALGSPAGSPISIYFLASREPPTMIENPRQTSAYRYPPKFGLHSPSFSRACMLRGAPGANLFVSGTASIVGCETMHPGDADAQTRETLANIEALLCEANRIVGSARYALEGLKFKVYVRQPCDLDAIKSALAERLGSETPIVYLRADVCREELLVEIEATGEPAET
jgi:enamine deaminase RidA (YjgF/YER057c/UK114 family)